VLFPKALQITLIFLYSSGFVCSFLVPGITWLKRPSRGPKARE
jgi:hypothetical protein